MFQLTREEWANLRSQSGISSSEGYGGRRFAPYAFTQEGVAILSTNHELAKKLENLERKYDSQFKAVFDAIRQLMASPVPKKKPIGFHKG